MKYINKAVLIFIIFTASAVYSQYAQNIIWVTPSYEMHIAHNTETVHSSGQSSISENEPIRDFTPAGDFYNSLNNLSVIEFSLTKPGFVNIKIYDEKGNTVDELARSSFGTGSHEVKWNSSKFLDGSYYYSVITGEYSKTKKIK